MLEATYLLVCVLTIISLMHRIACLRVCECYRCLSYDRPTEQADLLRAALRVVSGGGTIRVCMIAAAETRPPLLSLYRVYQLL